MQTEPIPQFTMSRIHVMIRRDGFGYFRRGTILLLLPNILWMWQSHWSLNMPLYPCIFPINFILIFIFLYGVTSVFFAYKNPSRHDILKYIRTFGEPETVLAELNTEMENPLGHVNSAYTFTGSGPEKADMFITQNFVIVFSKRTFKFVRLSDIVWLYKSFLRGHRLNIQTKDGSSTTIGGTSQFTVDKTLDFIYAQVPWVMNGYNKTMLKHWHKSSGEDRAYRQAVIEQVGLRKAEMLKVKNVTALTND